MLNNSANPPVGNPCVRSPSNRAANAWPRTVHARASRECVQLTFGRRLSIVRRTRAVMELRILSNLANSLLQTILAWHVISIITQTLVPSGGHNDRHYGALFSGALSKLSSCVCVCVLLFICKDLNPGLSYTHAKYARWGFPESRKWFMENILVRTVFSFAESPCTRDEHILGAVHIVVCIIIIATVWEHKARQMTWYFYRVHRHTWMQMQEEGAQSGI